MNARWYWPVCVVFCEVHVSTEEMLFTQTRHIVLPACLWFMLFLGLNFFKYKKLTKGWNLTWWVKRLYFNALFFFQYLHRLFFSVLISNGECFIPVYHLLYLLMTFSPQSGQNSLFVQSLSLGGSFSFWVREGDILNLVFKIPTVTTLYFNQFCTYEIIVYFFCISILMFH